MAGENQSGRIGSADRAFAASPSSPQAVSPVPASIPLRDAMLRHARNLERYPFESATMAEAGGLAANAIRSAIREVHGVEGETLYDTLSAAAGYLRNAQIDLETGAPKATALRTIKGGLKRVEDALASMNAEAA